MPFVKNSNRNFLTFFRKAFTYLVVTILSFPASLLFTNVFNLNQKVEALSATGGTITTSGSYTIHTFTSSGTFTPNSSGNVEVLVVAGGGGGTGVGGGGAGGLVYNAAYAVTAGAITVTVGNGGAVNTNGNNSVFGSITALGGGSGGGWAINGYNGGSGGGGGHGSTTIGGTKTQGNSGGGTGFGYNGGGNGGFLGSYPGGGGGGAGGAGGTAASGTAAGNGGAGKAYSISGTSKYYAGGGGSGLANGSGTAGTGGSGVGGNGATKTVASTAPAVNTGSGGGGGADSQPGTAGAKGIVIVRYIASDSVAPTTSGAIASGAVGNNGWYKSNVKYVLTITDPAPSSGIASTLYCKDTTNTCTPNLTYPSPYAFGVETESATNYVRWRSTDVAGNVQAIQSDGPIKIDKTPTLNSNITINSNALYTTTAVNTLTLTGSDATSGLAQMQFSCDNSNWTTAETYSTSKSFNITNGATGCTATEGVKTIYAKVIDSAGNVSSSINDSITYYSSTLNKLSWDLTASNDYSYDSSLINVIGGKASLKSINQDFRYLKVETTANQSWISWPEIEVYDSTGTKRTPTGVSVSATYGTGVGSNAYDGDTTTGWTAGGYTGWIILDYGSTINVSRIRLYASNSPDPSNVIHYVRTSPNNTDWTDLITINEAQFTNSWYDFTTSSTYWNGYSTSTPTISNVSGKAIAYTSLTSFTETLGSGNAGTVKYQLSNNGTNWYWWNGSAWASASSYSTSNTASDINSHISTFSTQVGMGNLYYRTYLYASTSNTKVELDNIAIGFINDTTPPSAPNAMTTSDENFGEIIGSFTADIPSGSTDTGGSGLASYSLWKCDDELLTQSCIVIASGINGITVNVGSPYLPAEDNTMYYYWTSIDNASNTSNKSEAKALIMNAILPPPLTDTPTPTPTGSVTLTPIPGGTTIQNVEVGIVPLLETDWNTNLGTTAQTGQVVVGVEDTVNANIKVAELDVNFNTAPDWTGVTGATAENIAFFHSTQPISTITNGAASSYTLYVRKGEGDKVLICPGATSLLEVTLNCSGGFYLSEGETKNGATATVITNGLQYWKISGLTGTGGMSVLTGLRDTLSRLQTSVKSDHKITFGSTYGMIAGSTDSMVISFPNFDLTGLTLSDIELTDSLGNARTLASLPSANTWGVIIDTGSKTITFSVPTSGTGGYDAPSQIAIKIGTNAGGTNQITNPSAIGNSTVTVTLNNTAPGEMGEVNIPFVDADQVDITGYVTEYINFDIDTATGELPGVDAIIDCTFDSCLTHENGDPGLNYTVDLGELTSAVVNKSNGTSVAHSSGGNGIVNSIYFDISTNAPAGAVVTVKSLNGGLQGPGTNKIPSIGVETGADGIVRSDGDDIPANSGVYGYNLPVAADQILGTIIPNSLCDTVIEFCGANTLTPKTVFTTNNLPVDTARVRMDLAAAANYTNNPGLYTDTLTFVATATF